MSERADGGTHRQTRLPAPGDAGAGRNRQMSDTEPPDVVPRIRATRRADDGHWEKELAAKLDRRAREPLAVVRKREARSGLPVLDEPERERMRMLLTEGLAAAGLADPRLRLDLRPYAGLRASLEQERAGAFRRGERFTMRLSDGYAEAPDQALRGLGASLGVRLFSRRRKVPELARLLSEYYDLWQRSKDARDLQTRLRRARAKKQGRGPRGDTYDLADLTGRVAARFLGGRLRPVKVTWSTRRSYTVLGHHDGDLDTIVISKALDHVDVPESVVAYVLYHELLHHLMGIQEGPNHNRRLHPPAFRRREKRFPMWPEADAYLDAMCTKTAPIARRRARREWHALWDASWEALPDRGDGALPGVGPNTPGRPTRRAV